MMVSLLASVLALTTPISSLGPVQSGLKAIAKTSSSHGEEPEPTSKTRSDCSDAWVERYLDLAARYRLHELDASRELVDWPPGEIRNVMDCLAIHPEAFRDIDFPAAVVMHTELAIETHQRRNPVSGEAHQAFARQLMDQLEDSERDAWLRQWLLLLGYTFQRPGVQPLDGPSMRFFKEALERFPRDGDVLLAIGSMHEAVGRVGRDRDEIKRAEGYYRRALETSPQHVEAHLRMAATLLERNELVTAREELVWVLDHARDSYLQYLGHLLLGDLHSRRRDWLQAARSYRSAMDTEPQWQMACLSLGYALRRFGERGQAQEVIEECLRLPVDHSDYEDGWWRYLLGQSHRGEIIMEAWRQKVLP